jgi:histidyl-tRNA synthetase
MDDESRADALNLAGDLRRHAVRVEVYPDASRKFDKALKHAATRGARLMAIIGENERASGQVSVRDLTTRVQDAVPRDRTVGEIAKRLNLNPEP